MRAPLEISDEEPYWLRSRDVSESSNIGGDQYFAEHDVTPPSEATSGDLPPAETDAVRALNREAAEQKTSHGKWQVTGSADRIEVLWPEFLGDTEDGTIWAVKTTAEFGLSAPARYIE
jgi:hypothetical protein